MRKYILSLLQDFKLVKVLGPEKKMESHFLLRIKVNIRPVSSHHGRSVALKQ
jgi:hypothetical protein